MGSVSIHAPTWGATPKNGEWCLLRAVSIHAPTWGATKSALFLSEVNGFQSTHPRGVRPMLAAEIAKHRTFQSTHPRGVRPGANGAARPWVVSIHAPTWGATTSLTSVSSTVVFQSTHPRGVRH